MKGDPELGYLQEDLFGGCLSPSEVCVESVGGVEVGRGPIAGRKGSSKRLPSSWPKQHPTPSSPPTNPKSSDFSGQLRPQFLGPSGLQVRNSLGGMGEADHSGTSSSLVSLLHRWAHTSRIRDTELRPRSRGTQPTWFRCLRETCPIALFVKLIFLSHGLGKIYI